MIDDPLNISMSNQPNINNEGILKSKPHILRLKRSNLWFPIAKGLAWSLIKPTSTKHYEIPEETLELMKYQDKYRDCSIFFVAPHKSMWETLGIPYAISWHDGDVPFIMMGNNLVKKEQGSLEKMLKYILDRSGVVGVEREENPRTSSPVMVSDISKIVLYNRNVLIFAEGTRSKGGLIKDFKPAGFQGLVDAVSSGAKSFIVPVNVDYSQLIELNSFAGSNEIDNLVSAMVRDGFPLMDNPHQLMYLRNAYNGMQFVDLDTFTRIAEIALSKDKDIISSLALFKNKYTFKVKETKSWKINIGDVYISFGNPIPVIKGDNRKDLAKLSYDKCTDLVKIQPINVLSKAIVRLNPVFGEPIDNYALRSSIDDVVIDLQPFEDKIRDSNLYTKSEDIMSKSKIEIDSKLIEAYRIYNNNISHYVPK